MILFWDFISSRTFSRIFIFLKNILFPVLKNLPSCNLNQKRCYTKCMPHWFKDLCMLNHSLFLYYQLLWHRCFHISYPSVMIYDYEIVKTVYEQLIQKSYHKREIYIKPFMRELTPKIYTEQCWNNVKIKNIFTRLMLFVMQNLATCTDYQLSMLVLDKELFIYIF